MNSQHTRTTGLGFLSIAVAGLVLLVVTGCTSGISIGLTGTGSSTAPDGGQSQPVVLAGDLSQEIVDRLIAEPDGDHLYAALVKLTVSDSSVSAIASAGSSSDDADVLCDALYAAAQGVSDQVDTVEVSSDVAMMSRRSDDAGDKSCGLPHP